MRPLCLFRDVLTLYLHYRGLTRKARWEVGPSRKGRRLMWNEDWAGNALCNEARPDELFVRGAAQNRAKQLCAGCPVRTECLAEALDNQIEWGVWGGMTERERRALLRRRPNVTSWRRLLETAMADHVATVSVQTAELVHARPSTLTGRGSEPGAHRPTEGRRGRARPWTVPARRP